MFTFYEYPKCSTCRRAKAELKELGADFEAIDITLDTPKADQIKSWIENSSFTVKNFFNTSGQKQVNQQLHQPLRHQPCLSSQVHDKLDR